MTTRHSTKPAKTALLLCLFAIISFAAEKQKIGVFRGVDAKPQVEIKTMASDSIEPDATPTIIVYYTYSPSYRQFFYSAMMEKDRRYLMEELNVRAFFLTIDRPWRITAAGWNQLPSAKMSLSTGTPTPRKSRKLPSLQRRNGAPQTIRLKGPKDK